MENFLIELIRRPAPALLVIVRLFLIILGFVDKNNTVSVDQKKWKWAVFSGFFLLFVGLTLNLQNTQIKQDTGYNIKISEGYGSNFHDIEQLAGYSQEQCVDKCKQKQECIAVVFAKSIKPPNNNCWLKKELEKPLPPSSLSDVIELNRQ